MADRPTRYTRGCGFSLAAGFFPVLTLCERRIDLLKTVYVSEDAVSSEAFTRLRELVDPSRIVVSTRAVEKLGSKENDHAVAVFRTEEQKLDPSLDHTVLVNPSDMGNLGNTMRTMLAFGYRDLALITPCADHFNPRVVRASMGAFFSVRVQLFDSFDNYLKEYPRPFYPFVLQTERTLSSLESLPSRPLALVFGNEATGLPASFRTPDALRIEQSEDVDSLNLTTAIAVALYDFRYRIKRRD